MSITNFDVIIIFNYISKMPSAVVIKTKFL